MKILIHWLILSLAVLAVPYFVTGIHIGGIGVAIIVGAVLGFINLVIKPVISLLTLPLNVLTLGLFSLIVNATLFYFVGRVVEGFSIDSFTAAFWGALIVSVINWFANKVMKD
ncbi:MAG: phage holin family protein [Candidatus Pacebacteria bacterium]|nr:phage holin family protein [Candidatus Paceibacterota bacterium]